MRQTLISHPLRAQLTSDDIDPFTVVTKQIFAENTLQSDISKKGISVFGLTLESYFAQEYKMKNLLALKVLLEDRLPMITVLSHTIDPSHHKASD